MATHFFHYSDDPLAQAGRSGGGVAYTNAFSKRLA